MITEFFLIERHLNEIGSVLFVLRLQRYLFLYFLHKLFNLIEHWMSERAIYHKDTRRRNTKPCKENSSKWVTNPLEVGPLKIGFIRPYVFGLYNADIIHEAVRETAANLCNDLNVNYFCELYVHFLLLFNTMSRCFMQSECFIGIYV